MQIGLFGKLPAKGDFVTRAVPGEVLQHWEAWLERVVSGAKHHLGHNWEGVYEAAPVWRFWVGEMVFGHPVTGAMIPSRDRVGRRFPLLLILTSNSQPMPAPPLADGGSNQAWYDRLEAALLEATGEGFGGDVDRLVQGLPLPDGVSQAVAEDRRYAFIAYGESGLGPLLQDVRDHDHQLAASGRSYWWTAGNAYVGPAIISEAGLPDAGGFAAMLTGFGPPPAAAAPALETAPPPIPQDDMWGSQPDDASSWEAPADPEPEPAPAVTLEDSDSPFGAGAWDVPSSSDVPEELSMERADPAPADADETDSTDEGETADADSAEAEAPAGDTDDPDGGEEAADADAPPEDEADIAAEASEEPETEADPPETEDADAVQAAEDETQEPETAEPDSEGDAGEDAAEDDPMPDPDGDQPSAASEEAADGAEAADEGEPEAGEDDSADEDGANDTEDAADTALAADDPAADEADPEPEEGGLPEGVEDDDTSPFNVTPAPEKQEKRRLGGLFSLGGRKR